MQREQPVSMQLMHVAWFTNYDFCVCYHLRHIWVWHLRCGLAVGSWNFQSHRKGLQNPFLFGYLKDKFCKLDRRKRHPDRLAGTLSCSRRWWMAWTCNRATSCKIDATSYSQRARLKEPKNPSQVTVFFSLDDYQRVQVSDALKTHTFQKDFGCSWLLTLRLLFLWPCLQLEIDGSSNSSNSSSSSAVAVAQ